MKNVLLLTLILVTFLCAACGRDAPQDASLSTAISTLRPFPSTTATSSSAIPSGQSTELVSSDPTATPFVHVVKEGDTLLSIAIRYGVGLEELVLVNPGIDPQFLSVGQSLRIPGPGGEAVDVLLPTPTPVPVESSPVRCYEALTGELRCIATIANNLSVAIEALSGIVGLYDNQGQLILQKPSDSSLQFLPSNNSIPISVVFPDTPAGYSYAEIQILSAIQVDPEVSRFVPVAIEHLEWKSMDAGAGVSVSADILLPADLGDGSYSLRLLGMALDAQDEVVGFRIIEEVISPGGVDPIEVEFYILSLGPLAEEVQLVAEISSLD